MSRRPPPGAPPAAACQPLHPFAALLLQPHRLRGICKLPKKPKGGLQAWWGLRLCCSLRAAPCLPLAWHMPHTPSPGGPAPAPIAANNRSCCNLIAVCRLLSRLVLGITLDLCEDWLAGAEQEPALTCWAGSAAAQSPSGNSRSACGRGRIDFKLLLVAVAQLLPCSGEIYDWSINRQPAINLYTKPARMPFTVCVLHRSAACSWHPAYLHGTAALNPVTTNASARSRRRSSKLTVMRLRRMRQRRGGGEPRRLLGGRRQSAISGITEWSCEMPLP